MTKGTVQVLYGGRWSKMSKIMIALLAEYFKAVTIRRFHSTSKELQYIYIYILFYKRGNIELCSVEGLLTLELPCTPCLELL